MGGHSHHFDSILTTVLLSFANCGVDRNSRLANVCQFEDRAIIFYRADCAEHLERSKNLLQRYFPLCGLLQASVAEDVDVRVLCICDGIRHKDETVAAAQVKFRN